MIVAEAANAIGTGVSSRNSEVIHAGLYYPTGSLRAYHCPRGRRMLYDFCVSHGVPHRKCGKLVVATNEPEIEKLDAIRKQSQINGVEGVEMIEAAEARAMEPELACVAALHSPETGIVDSHRLHEGAAGRSRRSRRHDRVQHQGRPYHAGAGWLVAASRWRFDHWSTPSSTPPGLARSSLAASPRAIRKSACHGSFSARAATSVMRAGRCSRG